PRSILSFHATAPTEIYTLSLHDALPISLRIMQRVERVEELFLRPLLLTQEVHVVDQQQIDLAIAPAEIRHAPLLDGGDQVVREALARDVCDAAARVLREDRVTDRMHQVRLAQADAAIDEERIVHARRRLRHGTTRRGRQLVVRADDE